MIEVNSAIKHEVIKEIIKNEYPELVQVSETKMKIIYETENDMEYIEKVKSKLKSSKEMAGIYFSVLKTLQ